MKRRYMLLTGLALLAAIAVAFWPKLAVANGEYVVQVIQIQTNAYPDITLYVEVTDIAGQRVTDLEQVDFVVTEDGQPVDIVDFAGVNEERPVDIVFVFDTTGSMREEVNGVKDTCIRFAQELEDNGRDYRLGLVTFWDEVQAMYGAGGQLTDDVREFKRWIERIVANGGGDDPENDFGALKEAVQMSFRAEAQRIFILITDAPPHYYGDAPDEGVTFYDPDLSLEPVLDILAKQTITVYAVANNQRDFRQLASKTGGKFYDINRESDFTGIIEEIGGTIATQYRLTYQSPRPTYDGTRRDIRVEVSGSGDGSGGSGGGGYLEKHLLNIQSDPVVGILCMLPLLGLLLAPFGFTLAFRAGHPVPTTSSPEVESTSSSIPPPSTATTCPYCGQQLRPGARFCAHCGRSSSPPAAAPSSNCPNCGYPMRPEAKFCARCGYRK